MSVGCFFWGVSAEGAEEAGVGVDCPLDAGGAEQAQAVDGATGHVGPGGRGRGGVGDGVGHGGAVAGKVAAYHFHAVTGTET